MLKPIVLLSVLWLALLGWWAGPVMTLEPIVLIVGGTLTYLLIAFPRHVIGSAFQAVHPNNASEGDLSVYVHWLLDIGDWVRREGTLGLMSLDVQQPILRQGLQALADNRPAQWLEESLNAAIEKQHHTSLEAARVWEAAGGVAPTMGILGAVLGLMHMQDLHSLGPAFGATMLGVGVANLFCLPLAARIRYQARQTQLENQVILKGLLSIRANEHPWLLAEKLRPYATEPATV